MQCICTACGGEGRRRTTQCKRCLGVGLCEAPLPPPLPELPAEIAIIGGGLGGLALALALQHRGFTRATVYERDASFAARAQGYGLTLQQGSSALRALGLSLESISLVSGSNTALTRDGTLLGTYGRDVRLAEGAADGPTRRGASILPRQALREALLSQLRPGTVQWGRRLSHLAPVTGGEPKLAVTFTDGSSCIADVVVGADGIRSTVRAALLGGRPDPYPLTYRGLVVILGICETPPPPPGVASPALGSVVQMLDGETRIYTMPFARSTPPSTMWQLSFPVSDEAAAVALCAAPTVLQAEAVARLSGWAWPAPALLQATPLHAFTGYALYDRAPATHPAHLRGEAPREGAPVDDAMSRVTLLGDAAHPLTPFKGQGANQALLDGVELARALYASSVGPRVPLPGRSAPPLPGPALRGFEERMLARAAVKVASSAAAAASLHTPAALAPGCGVRAHIAERGGGGDGDL